jgi:hypothetical protein
MMIVNWSSDSANEVVNVRALLDHPRFCLTLDHPIEGDNNDDTRHGNHDTEAEENPPEAAVTKSIHLSEILDAIREQIAAASCSARELSDSRAIKLGSSLRKLVDADASLAAAARQFSNARSKT